MPTDTEPSRTRLTAGKVTAFTCPAGKTQAFLWDSDAPHLLLRVTPTGRKTYAFETRMNGRTLRRSIGTVKNWTLSQARDEARRLQVLVDSGKNPQDVERQQRAAEAARRSREAAQTVTVGEAWAAYVKQRTPRWGAYHLRDNRRMVAENGPLHEFMELRLADLNADTLEAWAKREAESRPTTGRLARRLLRAFLNWCSEESQYAPATPNPNPAAARKVREALGKPQAKRDRLKKEELPAWFAAVQALPNVTIAVYLQALLLTGTRSGELLGLRWEDVNTKWRGLTLRDKAESKGGEDGTREIPLTPYVWHLLAGLPRRGPYVFAGTRGQPMSRPTRAHQRACAVVGIEGLTLHGLRRTHATLSEWPELNLPPGVVAQVMGHKPSATVERHYKHRPLELLQPHYGRFEAWILKQAGVQFDARKKPGKLRAVG